MLLAVKCTCTGLHFVYGPMEVENAGLLSLHPSARSCGTACAFGSSPGRQCPARRCPPDDHPRHRPPRGSNTVAAHEDLTVMFPGAEYFSFGSGYDLATFGDDQHRKFIAFVKKTDTETAVFRLKPTETTDNGNFETVTTLKCIKYRTGSMLCVAQPASHRTDAALFEEVLWQPTLEEGDTELAEQNAGEMPAEKDEG